MKHGACNTTAWVYQAPVKRRRTPLPFCKSDGGKLAPTVAQTMPVPPSFDDVFSYEGETNSCMVIAIATALDMTYEAAHTALWRLGRTWGKGTPHHVGRSFMKPRSKEVKVRGSTVKKFLSEHPKGRFVLTIRGHAFAVIDGVVHDTQPVASGCRLQDAWEVEL